MSIKVSEMLLVSAQAVAEYREEHYSDRHVVVLGRDGWPLVPLLRKLGVPTSYFIFSRIQVGDEGTKMQWLREVPPHSLVVDTGYKGSIFDAIKEFDPSIEGVLLSSHGKYPQVSFPYSHSEVVAEIEKLPKIVGRGVAIDSKGLVRCPQDTRDNDETIEGLTPAQVVALNVKLCEELGIGKSWASFTGVSPKHRVPLKLNDWYTHVEEKSETCVPLSWYEMTKAWARKYHDLDFRPNTKYSDQGILSWYGVVSPKEFKKALRKYAYYEEKLEIRVMSFNKEEWFVYESFEMLKQDGRWWFTSLPYYTDAHDVWLDCLHQCGLEEYSEEFVNPPDPDEKWLYLLD